MQAGIVILHIIFLFWIAIWFYKKFHASPVQIYFLPALLFKFFAGIGVGIIYKYYYGGGDTFAYFHDAVALSNLFLQHPGSYIKAIFLSTYPEMLQGNLIYLEQERALLTAKILSFFTLVTCNNYWISGLYFSFFSFLGMFYLVKRLNEFVPAPKIIPAVAFLFFPSVVIWSSGILKEPLVMGSLCLIVAFYIPYLLQNEKVAVWKIFLSIVLAWLLWEIKYYYAAVLFPLLVAGLFTAYFKNKLSLVRNNFLGQAVIAMTLFFVFIIAASLFHPNLNIQSLLHIIVYNHDLYLQQSGNDNLIHFNNLQSTPGSFLKHLPLAVFSALFRPSFFDANNLLQYYVAFENALLLLLFIPGLYSFISISTYKHKLLLLLIAIYILSLATILPIASPNLGTLVRHKIGFLPFFIYLIMVCNPLVSKRKLLKKHC